MSRPGFKRLTPFSPTQISNCCVWLDASDTTTISLSGSNVTQWRDKSGSNNHGTGVNNPTYSNGTMNFVHASQTCFTLPNGALPSGNASCGYFVVFTNSDASVSGSAAVIGGGQPDGTWDGYEMFSKYSSVTQKMYWGVWSSAIDYVYTPINANTIFSTQYNNNGGGANGIGTMVVNGTIVGSQTGWGPLTRTNNNNYVGSMYRGTAYAHSGTISEVIVYSNALTTTQQQQIEGYLAQKWQFKNSFPQNHQANTAVIYPSPRRIKTAALQLPYYNSFSLSSITSASLALWLDAADSTTITGTSPITAWTDKSGLARPVTIVSGPTYGSTTRNGLNTLSFNNNTITSSIASAVGTGDFVLVAVWYQSSAGTNTVLSLGTSASSSQSLGFSGNKYNFYQYGSAQESAYSSTPSFVIHIGTRQSSVKAVYVNGTVGTTPASDSYNQTVTTVTIGKGDAFAITGEVAEIMVWTGTMNSTDRQLLESYLAQKWGLQSNLPVTHSNRTTPAGLPPITKQVYGQVHQAIYKKPTFLYTQNFSYTGATTTFTVPSGISPATLTVTMRGGGGGGGEYNSGGSGGLLVCIVPTTGGTTYTLTVAGGGVGTSIGGSGGAGGFGGGGKGGNGTVNNPTVPGSGGGGGTYMHSGATLIMACGGGGGNMYNNSSVSGNGGGQTGGSGTNPGYGGSQSAGGLGWTGTGDGNGSYLQGGTGAASYNGAGGGGGYYGGGAGVGGGGGSDYTTGLTVTTQTQGGASNGGATGTTGGNGSITITYYA